MRRLMEPRPEKKLHRVDELTEQHIGRDVTVGGQPWAVRGRLVERAPDPKGWQVLTVRRRDGRTSSITVPKETYVLVHRKKEAA